MLPWLRGNLSDWDCCGLLIRRGFVDRHREVWGMCFHQDFWEKIINPAILYVCGYTGAGSGSKLQNLAGSGSKFSSTILQLQICS